MKTNELMSKLDIMIPNPRCELEYNKDYELLIATVLSAQCTDARVNKVTKVLFEKYDTLEKLKDANIEDVKDIIKPIGTFNKKSLNIISIANRLIKDYNGVVPNDRKYLESLDGVGRKTTNVVLANLYNEPCIAVDTHVSRVSKRLGIARKNDDVLVIEKKLNKKFSKNKLNRLHHQLVLFGRYYCKAKNPNCVNCKLKEICKEKSQ